MRVAAVLLAVVAAVQPQGGNDSVQQAQPPRDTRIAATATGRIAGVVTTDEATPRPLRRARVILSGESLEMPRSTITGDDGAFVFEGVPPGRFVVGAEKPGYVRMNYGAARPNRPGIGVQVADRQTIRVAMRLPRGAVITGTIVDVDGQPARGVTVAALTRRFTGGGSEFSYVGAGVSSGPTDDRGIYRIYGLPAGEYFVVAQPAQSSYMPPGVVGTAVQMMSRGTAEKRRMLLSQVFHPGVADLGRASRVTVRSGDERGGIDVQLEYVPLATVTGSANLAGGLGPVRVTLWRTDEIARPQTAPVTTADTQGRFQFSSIAPGEYRVTARAASGDPSGGRGGGPLGAVQYAIADVAVSGEDVDVALSAVPAISIAGRIVFEGERPPPPSLPAQLRTPLFAPAANGGWPIPPLVVDGTHFSVDGIMPGVYRALPAGQGIRTPIGPWWLKSLTANGREMLDSTLDLRQSIDDAVATFSDRASEVSGRALDAGSAPVPETSVVVFSTDRGTWFFNSRRVAAVRPDREGRFTVSNLPPGDYRIAAADLDPNEWFDPAVLDRLLSASTPLRIAGTEKQTIDVIVR